MLSRIANQIYWFGRYIERVECTSRLVNVNTNLILDLPRNMPVGWDSLIAILGNQALFDRTHPAATEENVVRFLLLEENHPSSVIASLHAARNNLRGMRDLVPREVWEQTNMLYWYVKEHGENAMSRKGRQEFLESVRLESSLLFGVIDSIMSRDMPFDFLCVGIHLERADMTSRILDVRSASLLHAARTSLTPFENIQWMSVLKSLSAYHPYRRRKRARVTGADVLGFLLQDRYFPRTVGFCLGQIREHLERLPNSASCLDDCVELQTLVHGAEVPVMLEDGLHDFVDQIQMGLGKLHERVDQTYFNA